MRPEASDAVKQVAERARSLFQNEQADEAMALVTSALNDHDHPRLKRMQARLMMFFGDDAGAGAILRGIIPNIWEPGFWELAIAGSKHGYAVAAPEQKLLYFPVRKCGCTSLYNMMRGLNGEPPVGEEVHADQKHELVTFETLRNDYAGWHTLLVVRDPIERVRSYYHGNIIGRDHLLVHTDGRESFYGLPTKPDYETFIKNFDTYRRTFIVVRNHTDPITAFAGADPSLYDTITTLNGLQDALAALSEKIGTPLSVSHDMKTTGRAAGGQLTPEDDAALSDFYAQDYRNYSADKLASSVLENRFFLDCEIAVLDFLLDDAYGLWEIEELVAGFEARGRPTRLSAQKIADHLVKNGLADLYLEHRQKDLFQKQSRGEAEQILSGEKHWRAPKSLQTESFYSLFISPAGKAALKKA